MCIAQKIRMVPRHSVLHPFFLRLFCYEPKWRFSLFLSLSLSLSLSFPPLFASSRLGFCSCNLSSCPTRLLKTTTKNISRNVRASSMVIAVNRFLCSFFNGMQHKKRKMCATNNKKKTNKQKKPTNQTTKAINIRSDGTKRSHPHWHACSSSS